MPWLYPMNWQQKSKWQCHSCFVGPRVWLSLSHGILNITTFLIHLNHFCTKNGHNSLFKIRIFEIRCIVLWSDHGMILEAGVLGVLTYHSVSALNWFIWYRISSPLLGLLSVQVPPFTFFDILEPMNTNAIKQFYVHTVMPNECYTLIK